MNYTEILSNPARMRIMQYMAINGEATVKEIAEYHPDIPRRTLYRHIDFLIEAGTIIVIEEHRVRGAYERLLKDNTEEFVKSTDLSDSSYAFFMDLFTKFDHYNKKHIKERQLCRLKPESPRRCLLQAGHRIPGCGKSQPTGRETQFPRRT